ncbi:MAG: hypothetical protein JXL97_09555 [Bacteroidales bacterium]|nr:hypothetical protein [Bacteroidales bacterium]
MNKVNIIFIITFLTFLVLSSSEAKSQDYGATNWYESISATNKDGFKPPLTKKEEKIRRKAKRLSLTHKDIQVLNLKERGKDLTFKQKLRYPFAKRKKKKLDELQEKYDSQQKSQTSATPGYLEPDDKNALTIEEKELMKKAEQDTVELSKKEKRILKRAERKQKKQEKYEQKFKYVEVTAQEQAILDKKKHMPDSLTKDEKKQIKDIKKKIKHNAKTKDRIHQFYVDSAIATGAPMPIQKKKFSLPKISFRKKKMKPSSYSKKKMRIEKKFNTPPNNYSRIMEKKKGDKKLSKHDQKVLQKYRQKKPTNDWIYKQKMDKLNDKQFKKNQLKSTRKMMKKREKESKKPHKQRQKFLRKTKFLNLFKKKK